MIELKDATRIYKLGKKEIVGLKGIDLVVKKGEFVVVVGPSGSGKSTLLNLIGGMDTPTKGVVIVDGESLLGLNDKQLTNFRRYKVGFVFQFFNLISSLTALENIELPLKLRGINGNKMRREAIRYLDMVGISDLKDRFPSELSGGERQRVAIARALAKEAKVLLVDEPTGNLDTKSGKEVRGEINGIELGNRVENYSILEGGDIKSDNDIVVEHHYAEKHKIKPGQRIDIYINGKVKRFRVSGICFSPDHMIIFSPEGGLVRDFGVFYCHRKAITKSVNTFYIKVSDENKIDECASALKALFKNKGINAVVQPKDKIFSRVAVREDMKGMNSMADFITPLILVISSFILFIVLSRLVDRERREIGTLRAMGYSKWNIFSHYLAISGIVSISGLTLSIPLGFTISMLMMKGWAVHIYGIPGKFLPYELPDMTYVGYSAIFVVAFSILGAFFPSYRAASLTPAEAMRPYIGYKRGGKGTMGRFPESPLSKLVLRDIFGHKMRSISTIVATALLLSVGLVMALCIGSFNKAIEQWFDKRELWDIKVNFNRPQTGIIALNELRKIPGVERVEPYTGGAAEIYYKDKSTIIQIGVLNKNTRMHSFSLAKGSNSNSLIISEDVANRVGIAVGDRVALNVLFGPSFKIKVSGIMQELVASQGYILKNLPFCMGALLKVKNGKVEDVEKSVRRLSFIKSSVRKEELKDGWLGLMHMYMAVVYSMDIVMVILILIVIGVFGFITATEHEWEFVILKAMGYSNRKIILNSLLDILPLSVIGVIFGIPLCLRLTVLFTATFKNMMAIPGNFTFFLPDVIIVRSILMIGFSLLTVFFVTRSSLKRNVAERLRRVFETM